jgi:hypothetical protein
MADTVRRSMQNKLKSFIKKLWFFNRKWEVKGYDTFEGGDAYYSIGVFNTLKKAQEAAKLYLLNLEESQPTESSGGQDEEGIQDRVYIVDPNGSWCRVILGKNASLK